MSKKSRKSCVRRNSGISPVLVVGGGLLLIGLPVCRAAGLEGLDLLPSWQLSSAEGRAPADGAVAALRADGGPEPLLLASLDLVGDGRPAYAGPPANPSEISLRVAEALSPLGASARAPRFAANGEPALELRASPRMDAVVLVPPPNSTPEPPARRPEYPLRLAQVMVPRINAARQPRWGAGNDGPLDLRLSPGMVVVPGQPGMVVPGQPGMVPDQPPAGRSRATPPLVPVVGAPVPADDGEPVAFEGGSVRRSAASQPAAEPEATEGRGIGGWAIPPIRWAGSTGYNLRRTSSSDSVGGAGSSTTSLNQNLMANLRAASYIYAPWFAQVNGNLGLALGSNSSSGEQSQQSKTSSVVGGGELALFPASRFPFNASVSRSDSRTGDSVTAMEYTDTRFGLRQGYRSDDGLKNAYASLDHSTVESLSQPKNTVTALQGSYGTPLYTGLGVINNNLSGRYSVSRNGQGRNGTTLMGFNSSHSWSDQDNMSLSAYSGYTDNTMRYSSGGASGDTRGRYLQVGASGSWRPWFEDDDEQPLTVSGGVSYFNASTESGGLSSQSQRMSGNASAHYRYSNNLSMTGSGSLSYMTLPGSGQGGNRGLLLPTATGGISYTGDPLSFGNFSYNWNAGGSAGWQGGAGDSPSNMYYGTSLGHSLGRNYVLSRTDSVSLNFTQGVNLSQNQRTGATSSLSNNAMANYRLGLGSQFSGTVTATLSDTITTGANSQHYDSFNLGLSGFGQLSPRSSGSANLTFIWTSQKTDNSLNGFGQQNQVQRMTVMGSASYNHQRFAGVPGLRYTFMLNADTTLRDERMFGDVNGSPQKARYGVDNHFDYRIGRLDTRVSASMNESGGKKNALLFFQVTRQIGAY